MSMPPTTQQHRRPMPRPKASNTSWICTASSRVGASATAKRREGWSSSLCRMGSANAPVLPDPVSARPMTSRPAMPCGMASRWMAVGLVHLRPMQASTRDACRPSAAQAGAPVSSPSTAGAPGSVASTVISSPSSGATATASSSSLSSSSLLSAASSSSSSSPSSTSSASSATGSGCFFAFFEPGDAPDVFFGAAALAAASAAGGAAAAAFFRASAGDLAGDLACFRLGDAPAAPAEASR
mmetsp:Transcript_29605/g.104291  ORF Transcript_29605/g.104291 Transcript_29605/m.104291 type:complete len:240 (+) Transcript_29605:922-1641(+)